MIAAVLLAQARRADEARKLLQACREVVVPSHLRAELGNVIWKAVVLGDYPLEQVPALLDAASALPTTVVDIAELWQGAVLRGIAARHPVYDTLFVELAVREAIPMASYDRPLCKKFPDIVHPPAFLLQPAVSPA